MPTYSRRDFLAVTAASGLTLAAANTEARAGKAPAAAGTVLQPLDFDDAMLSGQSDYARMYGPIRNERFPIAGLNLRRFDPIYRRQRVQYAIGLPPGSLVIDPEKHFLYFLQPGGYAIRYGVGTGKAGFTWSGDATVKFRREWPDWYPVPEYIARRSIFFSWRLRKLEGGRGIPAGPDNPLGARALYLWRGAEDTLYRIHGTNEPYSVGRNVSSGCIRLTNHDAIDLYRRVREGAAVRVLPSSVAAG